LPGAEGFEGPSRRTRVCVQGQGWERGGDSGGWVRLPPGTWLRLHVALGVKLGRVGRAPASFEVSSREGAASSHPLVPRAPACRAAAPSRLLQTAPEPPLFFGCSLGSVWPRAFRSGQCTPRWLLGCASP